MSITWNKNFNWLNSREIISTRIIPYLNDMELNSRIDWTNEDYVGPKYKLRFFTTKILSYLNNVGLNSWIDWTIEDYVGPKYKYEIIYN